MALKKSNNTALLRPVETREYPRDVEGLIAQLADPDATARRWAARDLALHPQAAAALCERLIEEADDSVRSVIFSSAARMGGTDVVRALVPLLRSEEPALRNGAIEVLSGLPEAVAPHIEALLTDADSDVRIFTVNLLGDLKHSSVQTWLTNVLVNEPNVNVVGAALEVLAEVGTPACLPALEIAARRFADNGFIDFAVELTAQRIGTP